MGFGDILPRKTPKKININTSKAKRKDEKKQTALFATPRKRK
jgi:hypothetical protein